MQDFYQYLESSEFKKFKVAWGDAKQYHYARSPEEALEMAKDDYEHANPDGKRKKKDVKGWKGSEPVVTQVSNNVEELIDVLRNRSTDKSMDLDNDDMNTILKNMLYKARWGRLADDEKSLLKSAVAEFWNNPKTRHMFGKSTKRDPDEVEKQNGELFDSLISQGYFSKKRVKVEPDDKKRQPEWMQKAMQPKQPAAKPEPIPAFDTSGGQQLPKAPIGAVSTKSYAKQEGEDKRDYDLWWSRGDGSKDEKDADSNSILNKVRRVVKSGDDYEVHRISLPNPPKVPLGALRHMIRLSGIKVISTHSSDIGYDLDVARKVYQFPGAVGEAPADRMSDHYFAQAWLASQGKDMEEVFEKRIKIAIERAKKTKPWVIPAIVPPQVVRNAIREAGYRVVKTNVDPNTKSISVEFTNEQPQATTGKTIEHPSGLEDQRITKGWIEDGEDKDAKMTKLAAMRAMINQVVQKATDKNYVIDVPSYLGVPLPVVRSQIRDMGFRVYATYNYPNKLVRIQFTTL